MDVRMDYEIFSAIKKIKRKMLDSAESPDPIKESIREQLLRDVGYEIAKRHAQFTENTVGWNIGGEREEIEIKCVFSDLWDMAHEIEHLEEENMELRIELEKAKKEKFDRVICDILQEEE